MKGSEGSLKNLPDFRLEPLVVQGGHSPKCKMLEKQQVLEKTMSRFNFQNTVLMCFCDNHVESAYKEVYAEVYLHYKEGD